MGKKLWLDLRAALKVAGHTLVVRLLAALLGLAGAKEIADLLSAVPPA